MVDPLAWVFWCWVVMFLILVRGLTPDIHRKDDSCVNHPSTTQCVCRKNLPKGGKK